MGRSGDPGFDSFDLSFVQGQSAAGIPIPASPNRTPILTDGAGLEEGAELGELDEPENWSSPNEWPRPEVGHI